MCLCVYSLVFFQCSPPHIVLAPFNIALALSVSRIHRFEEQVTISLPKADLF